MADFADLLLLTVLVLGLFIASTSRLGAAVRGSALQGAALALLPPALALGGDGGVSWAHAAFLGLTTGVIKALLIPWLLARTIRLTGIHREVEPFVSLHLSLVLGAGLVGLSFWMAGSLVLPRPAASPLLVPVALSTLLLGFLVLVSRRKAITQVVGYLMLENGVFVFGQCALHEEPWAVELGILLDVLVGVFVMGIAIHHIRREFDHIDTVELATLKD